MTSEWPAAPDGAVIKANVAAALAEDMGDGDLTAGLLAPGAPLEVTVITRDDGVLAGRPWFHAVFRMLDESVSIDWNAADGDAVSAGQVLARLTGPARSILSGERSALNFLQLLSGTATLTRQYVQAVAGTPAVILDTRKTIPGLRLAQKYAVRMGGGQNHRMGLFDAILIKENHIAAAGGIAPVLSAARALARGAAVEIEVENLDQLAEAAAAGADRALLDNFPLDDLRTAVAHHGDTLQLEASGGITLSTVAAVAATGVHYISVGELTKRIQPLDLSMRFAEPPAA